VERELGAVIQGKSHGVLPGRAYFDTQFTAERFKQAGAAATQVIHVASHFQFSPGTEANSFLVLGDGSHLSLGDLRRQNYRFDYVDLLTLSACNTGLGGGHNKAGQEIEGFGVLAQEQGAKAVITSLWQVSDESTVVLMREFYSRKTGQQLSKAEALRQAQIAVRSLSQYRHPFYWAPFILMGNWQ
jgi:CHAT domain-containing protein